MAAMLLLQVMLTIFDRFVLRPTNSTDGRQLWICLLSGDAWSTSKVRHTEVGGAC